jgi:hypothetical protein
MKKNPRLQFSDEERAAPELKRPIKKADVAATRVEHARKKIPKRKRTVKVSSTDPSTGKKVARLRFEEIDRPAPPSKLTHTVAAAPGRAASSLLHREAHQSGESNVGVAGAHKLEETAEVSTRMAQSAYRTHKLRPHRAAARAERGLEKANVEALYQKSLRNNPKRLSNPSSRWQQKQVIKRQYAAAKRAGQSISSSMSTAKTAKVGARGTSQMAAFALRHKKGLGIAGAILLVLTFLLNVMSSCSVIAEGVLFTIAGSTYPSTDENLLAVERSYVSQEMALQERIDNIETEFPSYDEYRYDIGEISHNPHELASYLSAVFHEYTPAEVMDELQRIFRRQYKLTLTEKVEVRYYKETRTNTWVDEKGITHHEPYTVDVPYDYCILNVTLTSTALGSAVSGLLNQNQLEVYQTYLTTGGNRPLLFGGGTADYSPSIDLSGVLFVNGTRPGNQQVVNLAKAEAGNIGGYPYWSWYGFGSRVEWCACFVSWCYNQMGYSEPRFASCTSQGMPWFQARGQWGDKNYPDIAPGDAIFFDWKGDGDADHVGIVIGTDGTNVYTVEGNSGDACKIRSYPLGSNVIRGYGLMNWNE